MSNLSASTDLQPADGSTRPIVGFPLGTALLVLVIFCISGIVSCCYHYEKIRSLRRSSDSNSASAEPAAEPQDAAATATTKSTPFHQQESVTLSVLMPGDEFPKFVAWPSERLTTASVKSTEVATKTLPV
ncbi:uncharacterized protein At5g65660-like isoform X4 [Nymphaea colorata]|uniref:uncharacterized protein At5g65660-like isoform X4 n=1 Tax=Nymphaea colorata TaxID=210225 RepID=UPI00129EA203|nr:uncharacterized protein At5g65660-like isoform X4 [Nymphaea colorata]